MESEAQFKTILMDHYRYPRNRGRLAQAHVTKRGSNPRCGDDVEVAVRFHDDRLAQVVFEGRGCSVCIASASMMTEAVTGRTREQASALYREIATWFSETSQSPRIEGADFLQALSAVQRYPARQRCVLLAWQALNEALMAKIA